MDATARAIQGRGKRMKKLFVSVPMNGRSRDEIKASIAKMKAIAEIYEGEELELIDSLLTIPDGVKNTPVWCLGKSLEKLSEADVFIGIAEGYDWNGCHIEDEVASIYGIKRYRVHAADVVDNYNALMRKRREACIPVCEKEKLIV